MDSPAPPIVAISMDNALGQMAVSTSFGAPDVVAVKSAGRMFLVCEARSWERKTISAGCAHNAQVVLDAGIEILFWWPEIVT